MLVHHRCRIRSNLVLSAWTERCPSCARSSAPDIHACRGTQAASCTGSHARRLPLGLHHALSSVRPAAQAGLRGEVIVAESLVFVVVDQVVRILMFWRKVPHQALSGPDVVRRVLVGYWVARIFGVGLHLIRRHGWRVLTRRGRLWDLRRRYCRRMAIRRCGLGGSASGS